MSLKTICFDPPIPNALVVFVNPNTGKVVDGGLTDSEGKISLFLKEGTYELYVSKSGYNPYHKTVQITKDTVISVNLADPDVVDPIYLYNKNNEVINPATEDTLGSILSHAQWIGGHRLEARQCLVAEQTVDPSSHVDVLVLSGSGVACPPWRLIGKGVSAEKMWHWVMCDDKYAHIVSKPRLGDIAGKNPASRDFVEFGEIAVWCFTWDTTNNVYEVFRYPTATRHFFKNKYAVRFVNQDTSRQAVMGITVDYAVFVASTSIKMLSDEKVNPTDLRRLINFEFGGIASMVLWRPITLTERELNVAKAVLEGKTPPEQYIGLSEEEAQLWLQFGEGKHHYVELTVDEKKFANLKEFWEFIEWLQKEFNMKLLDVSLDVLNIPDYIPETK